MCVLQMVLGIIKLKIENKFFSLNKTVLLMWSTLFLMSLNGALNVLPKQGF